MNAESKPQLPHDADASRVIDALGGTVVAARLCEVSPQAVTQWRRNGIPRPWQRYLRLLKPDVFGPDVESAEEPEPREAA